MAKDYFQDIVPPANSGQNRPTITQPSSSLPGTPVPFRTQPVPDVSEESYGETPAAPSPEPGERSIRNIPAPVTRPRTRAMPDMRDGREVPGVGMGVPRRPITSRKWIWIAAGLSLIVLAVLLFISLRPTVVTLIPRSHPVTFDSSSQFTAYPAASAATGTLAYSVQSTDLEDSQVVPSQGTVHSEDKASGMITVYNDYQTTPLKLVKTTRFETTDGLVFRVPADIVIPAKKGSTPGQVSVTVIADKAGDKYNVPPSRFTLPGLKSSPSYTHVYAQSTSAMTGGFVGDKPGVAPGALESAVAEVRGRLESKARESIASNDSTIVFPDLMVITYQDIPSTVEAGGGVRIHQKAHVVAPVFAADAFAKSVAQAVSADAGDSSVRLVAGNGFSAHLLNASSSVGADSLQFAMTGTAQLIWNIDSTALAQALAGRDQSAFQAIVAGFPSIQEAHARIEPFWKNTFPADAESIKIEVGTVKP